MVDGESPLATALFDGRRDVDDRKTPAFGVAVHCTGSGIVTKALAHGADCLEYAVAYYQRGPYFAHYVIGFDGTIAQIADEHERAQHIGMTGPDRAAYLSGAWKARLPRVFTDAWAARWPGFKSPSHLYPTKLPNDSYVAFEMLVWQEGCPGTPRAAGLKYTTEQHDAAAALAADIATRWGFPLGWQRTGRLACHEDVSPLQRQKAGKGWDPGVIRAQPWFDWDYLLSRIEAA
jgi:hypothetical protein